MRTTLFRAILFVLIALQCWACGQEGKTKVPATATLLSVSTIEVSLPDTICTSREVEISVSTGAIIGVGEDDMPQFEQPDSNCVDTMIAAERNARRLLVFVPNEDLDSLRNRLDGKSRIIFTSIEEQAAVDAGEIPPPGSGTSSPDSLLTCYELLFQDTTFDSSQMLSICNSDSLCFTQLDTISTVINARDTVCFAHKLSNDGLQSPEEAITANDLGIFVGDNFFAFSEALSCYFVFISGEQVCIVGEPTNAVR